MRRELCGADTPKGPCTLLKGHTTGYHRHRLYQQIDWVVKSKLTGLTLEEGHARVPLNYAITRQLDNFDELIIELTHYNPSRVSDSQDNEDDEASAIQNDHEPFSNRSEQTGEPIAESQPLLRKCSVCGRNYEPVTSNQDHCSPKCLMVETISVGVGSSYCLWCNNEIPAEKRSHALYCKDKCRLEAFKADNCTYCGMPAGTRDHFVPRAYASTIEDITNPMRDIVPACLECNSTASDKVFETIEEKREYIQDQYRKKYAKLLESPEWTKDEIDALGHTLGSQIKAYHSMRERLLLRLAWEGII